MTMPLLVDPHALELPDVAASLSTDAELGLDAAAAAAALAAVGPNQLPAPRRPPYLRIAARQLADPLVALLVVAAGVSYAVGESLEAGVIAAIVLLNGVLGFVQEVGAERAVLALRRTLHPVAAVVRDSAECEVPVAEVVPGDLLVLREGDRVAADARVVAGERLDVDESALTGESAPVGKSSSPVGTTAPLAERRSMVFAGTGVTRGRGRAIVVATGAATEVGRIAGLTSAAKPPRTPLQRQLGRLSRAMVVLGGGVTALLTTGMLLRGESFEDSFLVGVSVAVAAVPEGLAATVTIALAVGARGMAARGAIVRRLGAVETLGGATVIAADKTGTLTVNQLRVVALRPEPGYTEADVVRVGALASTAEIVEGRVVGDPVDGAFLLRQGRTGISQPRLLELPFDPERRRATVVYGGCGTCHVVVKGAPETLFERARLNPARRAELDDAVAVWAAEGLRVLAVAERLLSGEPAEDDLDVELDLVGLVGLSDPLRPTAAASVAEARAAGLAVAMLTGDHPATAAAIAGSLGLDETPPCTGADIETVPADELVELVREHSVFARVTPGDKLRLVEAFQADGQVVAVTGDGINDTPALRRADVGIAMGGSGTEAAREAADVVLTDDDFETIVLAIAEGRRIRDNIRHFVAFLLSANLGEVLLFVVAILAGIGTPLTVVQVLTVNLLTDGLPAVALSRDPALPGIMAGGPRRRVGLFGRRFAAALGAIGVSVGLVATGAYLVGRALDPAAAQTMAYATLALSELALVFSIRSDLEPAWRARPNVLLVASVAASLGVVVLTIAVRPLRDAFGTVALDAGEAALVAALASVPLVLTEAAKALLRWRGRR